MYTDKNILDNILDSFIRLITRFDIVPASCLL